MRAAVLIVLIFATLRGISQQSEIDSLELILENQKQTDSVRVNTLLKLSDALVFKNLGDAGKFAQEAMENSTALNWEEGLAKSYNQLGLIEYYKPDYEKSLNALHKALGYSKGVKNIILEASIHNNIANIYADLKDYDKALSNYRSNLTLAREAAAKKNELIALFNIATIKTEQKQYLEAINEFLICLEMANKKPFQAYIPTICNNLARTYQYIDDNKKALKYLKLGLSSAQENGNMYSQSVILRNIGELYVDENQMDNAREALLKSITISKNNSSLEWESLAWETLSKVYENQNRTTDALDAYKTHITLRDSILNEEKKSELIKKDLLFENEKAQTIALAEISRQKTLRNSSMLGGGSLLLATLIGLVLYKRRRDALSQKAEAEFNTKVADTELKALRSQMNPHFIFNSLNSINSFIAKNDKIAASDYLIKFAKLMRQTLENSEKKEIPLKDDLELLTTYLEIESKRLDKKFTFEIKLDTELDAENTLVPPLILQPFMENSIWHGIAPKNGPGHIVVDVQKKGNMIVYAIDDDGVGRNKENLVEKADQNKSLGMKLTKSRIDIVNKRKNSNGNVRVIDKDEGVRVEVELPLQLAF
ncbi:histidine kinase [Pricia sp.]|uniref:tetratricopeptide repeat-containing sensor histidine kinase n=1 Tax=Pricia sp. TaxID=2268138 RepID=UPI00359321C6